MYWRLAFSGLSGPATSAYIHKGGRGKRGIAYVFLCSPCLSGAHGNRLFRCTTWPSRARAACT
jgi:hypothetical protein